MSHGPSQQFPCASLVIVRSATCGVGVSPHAKFGDRPRALTPPRRLRHFDLRTRPASTTASPASVPWTKHLTRNTVPIPRLSEYPNNPLAKRPERDSTDRMIRPGFLDSESRQDLIELARDGSAAHRLVRRATGAAGRRDELRGDRQSAVDRRRHDPDLVVAQHLNQQVAYKVLFYVTLYATCWMPGRPLIRISSPRGSGLE